jgi:hypothetical protein
MRSINEMAVRALRPAIVVTACALVAIIALHKITERMRASPRVGDILAFAPSAVAPNGDDTRLLVDRPDRFGCVLDLNVLRRTGGSLIVETEIGGDARHFRVHWAGGRTSGDTANCGGTADLIIDRSDLDILALTAGGFGVGPTPMPVFTSDIGN